MKTRLFFPILFACANWVLFTTNVKAFTGTGGGVSGNAYVITTAAQLAEIKDAPAAYYELGNDIPLTGDWTPITSFSGSLDGKGYFITNLQINSTSDNAGLFAQASGSISNLGIKIGTNGIRGTSNVAAIAGNTNGAITVSNCFVEGSIYAAGSNVGSIIGYNNTASVSISNCYVSVSITATGDGAGGIVGNNYLSTTGVTVTIANCYIIGSVIAGSGSAGAIIGGLGGSGSTVHRVTGNISNCVSACSVISAATATRIVAYIKPTVAVANFANNYAYEGTLVNGNTVTGAANDRNGLNKTKSELKTQSTYNWDFADVWTLGNGNYPFPVLKALSLSGQPQTCPEYLDNNVLFTIPAQQHGAISVYPASAFIGASVTITVTPDEGYRIAYFTIDGEDKTDDLIAGEDKSTYVLQLTKDRYTLNAYFTNFTGQGKGTVASPFIITTESELNSVRIDTTASFRLENDIQLTSEWSPVANFLATFDGNGKLISNLQINSFADVDTGVGLFGKVTGATIRNLGVKGSVKALYRIGGIVGQVESGLTTIENCYFIGDVEATGEEGGGNSNNFVYAGGIVGYNNFTTVNIHNCYVNGSIKSRTVAGGVIARSNGNFTTNISNSYVTASIEGGNISGGISGEANTGRTDRTGNINISNCLLAAPSIQGTTAGRISATSAATGITFTFTGNTAFEGTLVNENPVSSGGTADNAQGLNKTAQELTKAETFDAWDFTDIWTLGNNSTNGETYYPLPVLKGLSATEQPVTYPEHLKYDFIVPAGNTVAAADYLKSGDIIFYSDDDATGQLTGIAPGGLKVNGVVKLVKTFEEKKWYPIGFPFEIASVVDQADGTVLAAYNGDEGESVYTGEGSGDYWLKYYDGESNKFRYPGENAAIEENTGYIIQFPDFYEETDITVVFTSVSNPVLKNTGELSQELSSTRDNHGYRLVANPSVAEVASLSGADRYYKYDYNNHFGLLPDNTDNIELKPFEAIVAVKLTNEPIPLRVSLNIDDENPTGWRTPNVSGTSDPVVETKYYNLQGVEIRKPAEAGIYIVKEISASGKTETTKSFIKSN